MKSFKVGDCVRVLINPDYLSYSIVNKIGIIDYIYNDGQRCRIYIDTDPFNILIRKLEHHIEFNYEIV